MTTIGLVGCVKAKASTASPARDLYVSPLFRGRRRWVERNCDVWFILSALHGLVRPDQVLAPYDVTLADQPVAARRRWSSEVLDALRRELGDLSGADVRLLAGAPYRDHGLLEGLRRAGAHPTVVAGGLSLGQQLAFFAQDAPPAPLAATLPPAVPPRPPGARAGGYAPLAELLATVHSDRVDLSFRDLEQVLGRPLPASARNHRPWWGNSAASPQARAWLEAGWRIAGVDRDAGEVTFERVLAPAEPRSGGGR